MDAPDPAKAVWDADTGNRTEDAKMNNIIIICLLAVLLIPALFFTVRKLKKGGGCCPEHETVKAKKAADRNKAHYPYQVEMEIGGMTCGNCALKAANALNELPGTWARVSFETRKAQVRCRQEPDERALRNAVSAAGYVVMSWKQL